MSGESLKESLDAYKNQLQQVELAISNSHDDEERQELTSLKDNIQELIILTEENIQQLQPQNDRDPLAVEYALFKAAMEEENALAESNTSTNNIEEELTKLEGMKCRAPHLHQWGATEYHNAMITSVLPCENPTFAKIEVKILFINPTEQEMLPCPYFLEGNCKFSTENCRFSHGEIVAFCTLQEYIEPKFDTLKIGSKVLVKRDNKLWQKGTIKRIYTSEKCRVKMESPQTELDVEIHDVLPQWEEPNENESGESGEGDSDTEYEDVINMALTATATTQMLGDWEKHTKGFGSKLMQKMGYIVGTGLGKLSDGRVEPVSAIVLPTGKSLDYCMYLKEKAGNDQDLFSAERKLKRLRKKQAIRDRKAYEREKTKKNVNVFNFLNHALSTNSASDVAASSKSTHRQEIRKETCRNLNVAHLQIEEDMKKINRDLDKIKQSLERHSNVNSPMNKQLLGKLKLKQEELDHLKAKSTNISNERTLRSDKKKFTIF